MIENKKKILIGIAILAIFSILFFNFSAYGKETEKSNGNGINNVKIIIFYGQGCPHCAGLHDFFEELKKQNSNLIVEEYEIYFDKENRKMFEQLAEVYNTTVQGVPTVFIDNKVIVGFSNSIETELK